MAFYDLFVNFFALKNYSPNTIGRHVKNLKRVMRISKPEELHTNDKFENKQFKILKADEHDIYLNEEEIKKIENLGLSDSPTLDIARDVSLVGCYTAQRYSYYSTITKDDIQEVDGGRKILTIIQRKIGEIAIVPVRSSLDRILKKYDYTLPRT